MTSARIATLLLLASALPAQIPSIASSPRVETVPGKVLVERGKSRWHLNFDFRITNPGTTPALLDHIGLRVFDSQGALVQRKYVDRGGTAPGLDTMLTAPVPAGAMVHAFNPYHSFELDVDLARLEYELVFRHPSTRRLLGRVRLTVEPVHYETRAALHLPLQGRVLVRDGHDFLSHHRRLGMDLPPIRSLGVKTNSSRYAYDFVLIDEAGEMFRNRGARFEDWYGWDTPVLAPAAGTVAAVFNDFPDNTLTASGGVVRNPRVVITDLDTFAGNYVALDHGNGEYSMLGHLRMGSVPVQVGQVVAQGEVLGGMGLSGATSHVHLHYQLQDGADLWGSEGLPSPFRNYLLHLGEKSQQVDRGQIDSGDIVEATVVK